MWAIPIKHKSFKHGWFYHYRIHQPKTQDLCQNFSILKDYIYEMFENCPDNYFNDGPRSSSLRFSVPTNIEEVENHEVSLLAKEGLNSKAYKTAHSNVQMFMLSFDKKTIGIEVPIWLQADEIENYSKIFDSDLPLTGHIDALRIEDDKIWIWDFKPKAHKEKYAHTQVYFYALMLSKRTGIPIEHFKCGYFDEHKAFVFDPRGVEL